jgi:hypothetical protein
VPGDRRRSQILHDVLEADRKPDSELRQNNVFVMSWPSKSDGKQ